MPFGVAALVLCVVPLVAPASGTYAIGGHRTEYLVEPLGVDVARPRFSWDLTLESQSGAAPRGRGVAFYQVQVSTTSDMKELAWDSGKVASKRTSLVAYGSSTPLKSDTHYYWRAQCWLDDGSLVAWPAQHAASFRTGLFTRADWVGQWITAGAGVSGPLLRKEFVLPAGIVVSQATVHVAGIGYSEVFINGQKLGDHKLDSGWTDFSKRVAYSTFDVASLLATRRNAVGVMLGNGWFSCASGAGGREAQPGCANEPPQLLLQLRVNGKPIIVSDTSWKVAAGPITYDSLYNGEAFDARAAARLAGWTSVAYDDEKLWTAAQLASSVANNATLSSALFEPVRHVSELTPRAVTSPSAGVQVFDFGQNIAGVVRLRGLVCPAGANVTIRHAELLMHPPYGAHDGSIYVGNLRKAQATDVYTCRGDPRGEDYTPTFTQHGFRYAEVSGGGHLLHDDQVTALEMHTAIEQHSALAFSQPMLNQIQHMTLWGQKANVMQGVPTDCPQRDERRGWTGDAALTAEEAVLNYRMGAVYTRWLDQYVDDQTSSGASNNFVPALGTGAGAPNWQSAFPSLVWALYQYYGDTTAATTHHAALVKYYDNLERQYNSTGLAKYATGFGDWVPPPPQPMGDHHLIGSFALLHDLQMGVDFFAGSKHPQAAAEVKRCAALLERASAEFHTTFFDSAKGYYGSGMQSEQAMPLYLGIVPHAVYGAVLNYTINDILVTHGGHTTSGIIGIKCMLEVLSRAGRTDVVLQMLLTDTYPSYGYMLKGGVLGVEPATTLWELWNSDQAGPGMNSRNHIMFGTVSSWLHKWLAGITPLKPGYEAVRIAPTGVGSCLLSAGIGLPECNLTSASASLETPHGEVAASWTLVPVSHTCDYVHENELLYLSCPLAGDTIAAIDFASFGTPSGTCTVPGCSNNTFTRASSCDLKTSQAVVAKLCVGQASCNLTASVTTFGDDPCVGTVKALAVAAHCTRPAPPGGAQRLSLQATVPLGATGQIAVPVATPTSTTTISEAGTLIWRAGKFVPGVAGITSAKLVGGAKQATVEFEVASGSYAFEASPA